MQEYDNDDDHKMSTTRQKYSIQFCYVYILQTITNMLVLFGLGYAFSIWQKVEPRIEEVVHMVGNVSLRIEDTLDHMCSLFKPAPAFCTTGVQ